MSNPIEIPLTIVPFRFEGYAKSDALLITIARQDCELAWFCSAITHTDRIESNGGNGASAQEQTRYA